MSRAEAMALLRGMRREEKPEGRTLWFDDQGFAVACLINGTHCGPYVVVHEARGPLHTFAGATALELLACGREAR